MAGEISSLGIGSGVLTADVIDQLKNNEKALTVTPIENKITLEQQKGQALELLDSLLTTFQASVDALDYDVLYQERTVSGNNDGVNVTAAAGTDIQSFSIDVTELAQKSVLESGSFSSTTTKVASGNGTLTLSVGGKDYTVDYTATTTLEGLKTAINDNAGDAVTASILQVGENDYRLVITSDETGADQNVVLSDSVGGSMSYNITSSTDILTSGAFASTDDTITTGAVAQSDRFELSQALTDGGVSVTIDGVVYSTAFNGTHDQTLLDFKSAIDASGLYTATIDGNNVTIEANTSGVPYTIDVPFSTTDTGGATASTTSLATNDDNSGTLSVTIDGTTYDINYDYTMTLSQLSTAINTAVGSDVATVTDDFRLAIESTATGNDATLSIVDNNGYLKNALTSYATSDPASQIQEGRDATFKFNGIDITRSSNTIDDLVVGVTIELLQEGGSSNISIAQDRSKISDELQAMTTSYNSLMKQVDSMTLSDLENGKVGIFNGDNTIKSIGREITKVITSVNADGYSLAQFGISLEQDGSMKFEEDEFNTQYDLDPIASEAFFSGGYDDEGEAFDGIFTTLNNRLDYYAGTSGLMSTLSEASNNSVTSLTAERTRTLELLNARYETMTLRFIQYDAIINRINSQFTSLQQQIEMAINAKN